MRSVGERKKALKEFKEGKVRILIATDIAARGIDIQELPFVVNMTLPDKPETYIHRTGRVGRAKRQGMAISLVATVDERVWYCQSGEKPPCKDTTDHADGGKTPLVENDRLSTMPSNIPLLKETAYGIQNQSS